MKFMKDDVCISSYRELQLTLKCTIPKLKCSEYERATEIKILFRVYRLLSLT
jgi:hypothetical protein